MVVTDRASIDRLLELYSRMHSDEEAGGPAEPARAFADTVRPWALPAARAARGLGVYCYVST